MATDVVRAPLEGVDSPAVGEVVADVAHALRNHFHRLYYWMDLLGEQSLDGEARAALEAAGTTLRSIERLTTGAMTLSRYLEITPISMEVNEVAQCIAQSLLRQGAAVHLESGLAGGAHVAIDAGHVSRTVEIVGARLGATAGPATSIEMQAEVDDEGWAVFTMHAKGKLDQTDGDVEQMLDWAQAERVLQLHGGRLLWEVAGVAEHRAVMLLPVAR